MSLQTLRNVTVKQLTRAARIKGRIERLETQLNSLLGVEEPRTVGGTVRRRRRMSAAAKRKIAAAARKRWAKWRADKK
jgi:hypothetical protein